MRPYLKAILFLIILWILDVGLRKGFVAFFLPFQVPFIQTALILFTLFAVLSLAITKWFGKSDNILLSDLGISLSVKNRVDFIYGFIIGVFLWAIVSLAQSLLTGFSWTLRPEVNPLNILYGLMFIFIADLGTEVFTRGYPLTRFKDSMGSYGAIIVMTVFVGVKSYDFNSSGELLFYIMLIPALHTIFFSIIYFKTKRLGGALGMHTGANLVTISIFDLREEAEGQVIPPGIFQPDKVLETLSMTALQLPYVLMAILVSIIAFFWWKKQ